MIEFVVLLMITQQDDSLNMFSEENGNVLKLVLNENVSLIQDQKALSFFLGGGERGGAMQNGGRGSNMNVF